MSFPHVTRLFLHHYTLLLAGVALGLQRMLRNCDVLKVGHFILPSSCEHSLTYVLCKHKNSSSTAVSDLNNKTCAIAKNIIEQNQKTNAGILVEPHPKKIYSSNQFKAQNWRIGLFVLLNFVLFSIFLYINKTNFSKCYMMMMRLCNKHHMGKKL